MPERPTPTPVISTPEVERGFDLREALSFLWRHWKFIAGVVALVLVVGVVHLSRETPLYTATSKVLLAQHQEAAPTATSPGGFTFDIAYVQSQMAIIRSVVFLDRVVKREHLVSEDAGGDRVSAEPTGKRTLFSSILGSVLSFLRLAPSHPVAPRAVTAGADKIPPNDLAAIEALAGALRVSSVQGEPYVLAISVTSPDPARAARLANAVASNYLVDQLDTRYEAARRASEWLSARLADLRRELRQSEDAVAAFRAKHDLAEGGRLTLNKQELSALNARLLAAKADLAQKRARLQLLGAIEAKGGSLEAMPDIAAAGTLGGLLQQKSALSAREANLLSRYGPEYPVVINIKAELRDVDGSIARETQHLAAQIRNDYTLAKARVASLEETLGAATGQTTLDDKEAIRLRELERTAAVNKTLFENFLNRAKITAAQSTFRPQDARIITPALPSGAPSYPRTTRFLVIDLGLGLVLGIGGAVAKEKLNAGFTTPKQIEEELGLPLLSSVSHLRPRERVIDGRIVAIHDQPLLRPLSRFSEAIRSLRSGIQMTNVDNPPKVIEVTSTAPSEGKTTIALSLAASAAAAKLKVLFIDSDLRHPSATRLFGLEKEAGLVDLLLGRVDEVEAIRFIEEKGYSVLASGNQTQNPTDLLSSERMRSLLAAFREAYDLVVLDTPPAGPVIDPIIVSQLAEKVVLVVRWGMTAREVVRESAQRLSGHPKIAGIVFNHVNDRLAQKYGKYASTYYYGRRYYKNYYQS